MNITIVGGGIGGMALALSLHDAGFQDVDIYESAPTVKELGVGINLQTHAVRELTELGLLDDLLDVGVPVDEVVYYSKLGQRIRADPRGTGRRLPLAAGLDPPRAAAGHSVPGRAPTTRPRTRSHRSPPCEFRPAGRRRVGRVCQPRGRGPGRTRRRRTCSSAATASIPSRARRSTPRKVRRAGTGSPCGAASRAASPCFPAAR